MGREEQIRLIAYQVWAEEGYYNGRDVEHWLKAEAIWEEKLKESVAKDAKTKSKRTIQKGKRKRPGTKKQ